MTRKHHAVLTPFKPLAAENSVLQGYVTRAQLAETYKVTPGTIAVWQRRDRLPVHRVGTQPLYVLDEVSEWFKARLNRMHGGVFGSPVQEAALDEAYGRMVRAERRA